MKASTLVTGFPGFIAGRLVEKLATADRRMYLLAEKRFAEKAEADAAMLAAKLGLSGDDLKVVLGDITCADLGLSGTDSQELRGSVDEVFHLAAVYDLAVSKDLAYRVNVNGTANVNAFVRSLGSLRRYNYVSTCYVAGRRSGRILETELEHSAGFRNFYEETKYLAEIEVEKLKAEIPVTVIRPSVVVGDSRTGETAKYDGIYYLIQYLLMAPSLLRLINVGNKDVTLNLVPVDFVVDGMVAISHNEGAVGKTVALADPNPLSTAELFDSIAQAIVGKQSMLTPPAGLVRFGLNLPFSPPLTGLPHSGVPYFFLSQNYDTSLACGLLSESGPKCPDFRSYVGNLIEFVERNPKL